MDNNKKKYSRNLRKNMTTQEIKLWQKIRKRQFYGFKFLRQYTFDKYIVDFICREKKIIIEIDGGQHNEFQNSEYDKSRTIFLNSLGYTVIRFWNNEIDENIEGVWDRIKEVFEISD